MKLLPVIKTGFSRSVRTWKGIIIFWAVSFITVSLLVVPLKANMKSALGNSMITEKLVKGIDTDVLGDLGTNLHSLVSSLSAGIIMISLAAVFLNIFFTGGLFYSVKNGSERFSTDFFFRASSKNFWAYMIISGMLYILLIALFIIIVVIPVSVAGNDESVSEGMTFRIFVVCMSLYLLAIAVILLVADYSRAWQASRTKNNGFKALGFGFSKTFRTFSSSLQLMLIMLILQAVIIWLVTKVIGGNMPLKEGGIFLLFVISQILFLLKLFIKVLRYGCVTALMEQNLPGGATTNDQPLISYTESADPNHGFRPDNDILI